MLTKVNKLSLAEGLQALVENLEREIAERNIQIDATKEVLAIVGVKAPPCRAPEPATKEAATKPKKVKKTKRAPKKVPKKAKVNPPTEGTIEAKGLRVLEDSPGEFITTVAIALATGIDRKHVGSLISRLRTRGYKIETAQTLRDLGENVPEGVSGYRLVR